MLDNNPYYELITLFYFENQTREKLLNYTFFNVKLNLSLLNNLNMNILIRRLSGIVRMNESYYEEGFQIACYFW